MAELQSKPSFLSDVVVQELADGEVLTYDETASKGISQNPLSTFNLSNLSDYAITNPTDSSSLIYNSFLSKWIDTSNQIITMDFSLYVR